jgi:hypothetical protein
MHYFVVVADASNVGTVMPHSTFRAVIEGAESFTVSDDGEATVVNDDAIYFARYMFEPDDGTSFIITRGDHDPATPQGSEVIKEMNVYREVLQVRTKAKDDPNELKAITIRVPSGYVYFGEGLERVSLWLDNDGNGTGDSLLAEGAAKKGKSEIVLTLDKNLSYNTNEEKFLVLKADFDLSYLEKGKIQIAPNGVRLQDEVPIWSLPINSKESVMDPGVAPIPPSPSCSCSLVW